MLELYISQTCPYCRKVMNFLEENKIEYKKMDVAVTKNLDVLINVGGKHQVPFLIDEHVNMYESDDIINYIKEHYVL